MKTQLIKTAYKNILKPILFTQEPEKMHDVFVKLGSKLGKIQVGKKLTKFLFYYENPKLSQEILGITFKNPVGLSAGFDKNADTIDIMSDVGFGFMQIGTITLNPYGGNPPPLAYRLPKSKSLVVNYGLKNIGASKIIAKIKNSNPNNILGVSIGKTNCAETADLVCGINDYYKCLELVQNSKIGDFYTINVSCPNTFGGEPFTTAESLKQLLIKLYSKKIYKPVFLKMPINLAWEKFKPLLELCVEFNVEGVIIGNLNKDRSDPRIKDEIPEGLKGSLSGIPTKELSNELIKKTYAAFGDKLVIIGVGGIFSAEDAYEKIKYGASLVQLITGMIFEGPQLIGEINKNIVEMLTEEGLENISQAVGSYHKGIN